MKNGFDFAKNRGYFQGWGQVSCSNESVKDAKEKKEERKKLPNQNI